MIITNYKVGALNMGYVAQSEKRPVCGQNNRGSVDLFNDLQ